MIQLEEYTRLVHWMARKYTWSVAEYDELVSGAWSGLALAKERFDPSKGYKFITYATWYVRAGVQKVVNHHIKENHRSLDAQDENGRSGLDRLAAPEEAADGPDVGPQVRHLLAALSSDEAVLMSRLWDIDGAKSGSEHRKAVRAEEAAAIKKLRKCV